MRRTKKQELDKTKLKILKYWKDGIRVVEIPLYDIQDAMLPKVIMSDYQFSILLNLGMTTRPRVNKTSGIIEIWCPCTQDYVRLVYLVANIHSDQRISFKDGNEWNMLESNLKIVEPDVPTYYRQKHLDVSVTGTYWDTIDVYDLDQEKAKLRIPSGDKEYDDWIFKYKNTPTEDVWVRDKIIKDEI